jgi:hypothetical protein
MNASKTKTFRIDTKNKKQMEFWGKQIPKNQKKKLSICPHCKEKFYYWQIASAHAKEFKHWGDYSI